MRAVTSMSDSRKGARLNSIVARGHSDSLASVGPSAAVPSSRPRDAADSNGLHFDGRWLSSRFFVPIVHYAFELLFICTSRASEVMSLPAAVSQQKPDGRSTTSNHARTTPASILTRPRPQQESDLIHQRRNRGSATSHAPTTPSTAYSSCRRRTRDAAPSPSASMDDRDPNSNDREWWHRRAHERAYQTVQHDNAIK
jgi:hypothetical protein